MATETQDPSQQQSPEDRASADELEALHNLPSANRGEPVPADELEKHFNMPSAEKPVYDQPGNQAGNTRSNLKNLENKGGAAPELSLYKGAGAKGKPQEEAANGGAAAGKSLYTEPDEELDTKGIRGLRNKLFVVYRRRTLAGGGVLATIIAAVLFITIGRGPFQIIQMAQLLQEFHLSSQQDASDDRVTKLARFIHYASKGELQYTRVGVFQANWGKSIEADFNKSGIESAYSSKFKFFDGYVIDPEQLANSELDEFKGKSPAEITDAIKEKFPDVSIESHPTDPGKIFINAKGLGYRKSLSLSSFMLQATGKNKLASAIEARVMGHIYGLSWHPFSIAKTKLGRSLEDRTAARAAEDEEIDEGTTTGEVEPVDGNPNDPNAAQDTASAKQALQDAENAGEKAGEGAKGGDAGAISGLKDSFHFKLATGGAGAAGILCLVEGLGAKADNIKQAEIVLPVARMAWLVISGAGQTQSGQDISLSQLGYLSGQFNGVDSTGQQSSWIQAESIQAELGNGNTGVPPDGTLNSIGKNGNPFAFLSTGALGSFLNPICSGVGQAILGVVSFFGANVIDLAGQAVLAYVTPSLENMIARWIAGTPVDALGTTGADFGNYANYGTAIAANGAAITNGATALSSQQAYQLKTTSDVAYQKQFQQESLTQRLFSPSDSRTPVGKLVDNISPSVTQNLSNIGSALLNFTHTFASLSNLFFKPTQAASAGWDYGFPQFGFSQEDLDNPAVENPYQNAEDAVNILNSSGSTYTDRAQKCFGIKLSKDTQGNWNVDNESIPAYDKMPSDCTDSSTDWLKVRFFIFDSKTADSLGCYYGDETACDNVGFGNNSATSQTSTDSGTSGPNNTSTQIIGNIGESSDTVACASNTKDIGVVTSQYVGSVKVGSAPLQIRLCQLSSITGFGNNTQGVQISGGAVVNSRVAGAWEALGEAAKKAGVSLDASSSFRLADSCGGTGDGGACASPGTSMHQLGVAIDFGSIYNQEGGNANLSNTTSCSPREEAAGNTEWDWLNDNSAGYGFKQYTAEAWHWDPLGGSNRCGGDGTK